MRFLKTLTRLATAVTLLFGAELKIATAPLVTHEWGTFYVGRAREWRGGGMGAAAGSRSCM